MVGLSSIKPETEWLKHLNRSETPSEAEASIFSHPTESTAPVYLWELVRSKLSRRY